MHVDAADSTVGGVGQTQFAVFFGDGCQVSEFLRTARGVIFRVVSFSARERFVMCSWAPRNLKYWKTTAGKKMSVFRASE